MRGYVIKLMFLLVLMLCPVFVYACRNEQKVKYQEMAKNIAYNYELKEENGKITFTLTFSNVPKELAIRDALKNRWYYSKGKDITISKLKEGDNYRYEVYTVDGQGCDNISLFTFNIVLPFYNKYYGDPVCTGVEKYYLCNKWLNNQYKYEDWKARVQKYKDSLVVEKPETVKTRTEKLIEKIVDIYEKWYFIVLPIIIVGGTITIYIYNKKRELF